MKALNRAMVAMCLATLFTVEASAQPATFWNALGVTQSLKCLRNATVNPHGNHPCLECPHPPLPIADPANLESPNPAIKLAAEIKQQEDLKKQKIKALKYLSKIGCGCYPGVAEAFAAATEDCTEDVRLAAAEAIQDAAGEVCACCNGEGCCSEALLKKIAERAYARDDSGCFVEPSERVRKAMREALKKCCRGLPPEYEPAPPENVPPPVRQDDESIPDDEDAESIPNPDGEEGVEGYDESVDGYEAGPDEGLDTNIQGGAESTRFQPNAQGQGDSVANVSAQLGDHQGAGDDRPLRWVSGRVKAIDPETRRVLIEHQDGVSVSGSTAEVFHRFLLGSEKVGSMSVVAAEAGRLVARAPVSMKYLEVGAEVRVQVKETTVNAAPVHVASPIKAVAVRASLPTSNDLISTGEMTHRTEEATAINSSDTAQFESQSKGGYVEVTDDLNEAGLTYQEANHDKFAIADQAQANYQPRRLPLLAESNTNPSNHVASVIQDGEQRLMVDNQQRQAGDALNETTSSPAAAAIGPESKEQADKLAHLFFKADRSRTAIHQQAPTASIFSATRNVAFAVSEEEAESGTVVVPQSATAPLSHLKRAEQLNQFFPRLNKSGGQVVR